MSIVELWVDTETGVNYMFVKDGYGGGLSPAGRERKACYHEMRKKPGQPGFFLRFLYRSSSLKMHPQYFCI